MSDLLWSFVVVGLGGAAGAMARFGLTMATLRFSDTIPVGTLVSNRLLFGVGFCGAFTTLSALVVELGAMAQRDDLGVAFAYLLTTLIGGFACFYAGAALVRQLTQSPLG